MWAEISAQLKPAKTPSWGRPWALASYASLIVAVGAGLLWVADSPLETPSNEALAVVQQLRPELYQRNLPALAALDEAINDVEQRLANQSNQRLERQLERYLLWRQEMITSLVEVAKTNVG